MKTVISTLAILFSFNCFAQWSQVNNGISNLGSGATLLGNSDSCLFAKTIGGYKMYRTYDFGNNWNEVQTPVAFNLPSSGCFFGNKYFAGLNSSMECIYYTTNNGNSWTITNGCPKATVVRGFKEMFNYLFAYTSSKGIYRSTDGGITWDTANVGLTNLNVIWMEKTSTKLFAATIGGGLYVSSDTGATWNTANSGISGFHLNGTFVFKMTNKLFYVSQGSGYYESSDSGATWTTWAKPAAMGVQLKNYSRYGNIQYIKSGYVSPLNDSVYVSLDEGISWTNITDNLDPSDLNFEEIVEFGGYAFGAYNISSPNKGIYRRNISLGITENSDLLNFTYYPNPFNDYILLPVIRNKIIAKVNLYNSQGIVTLTLNNTLNNTIKLDCSNQTDGFYILEIITSDNLSLRRPIIKCGTYH